MRHIVLHRDAVDPDGTFGYFDVDDVRFWTVERPWLDNKRFESCIPQDTYQCKVVYSTTNKVIGMDRAYEVLNVPNRDGIHMHVANYPRDVQGCIGIGAARAWVGGRFLVTHTREATAKFYEIMKDQPFTLEIRGL